MSLGKYQTIAAAREEMTNMVSSGGWVRAGEDPFHLTAYGVGLFRRDVTDGKFYSVATVPLVPQREKGLSSSAAPALKTKKKKNDTESFLSNAGGLAWYQSMQGASNVVLREVERACIRAAAVISTGSNGGGGNDRLEASVHVYGSHALGASLPAISDLDTVVQLRAKTPGDDDLIRSTSSSQYLQAVSARLEYLHRNSRIRMRVSSAGGMALYILTIKLAPQYPSLDILLCRMDASGKPIDMTSQTAFNTLKDTEAVLESVQTASSLSSAAAANDMKFSILEVYQGALRVIKVWADRRQICGANMGFLGGGGWAVLLAWTIEQTNRVPEQDMSLTEAIHGLVRHFFENILRLWSNASRGVALSNSTIDPFTLEDAAEMAASRGSMAVMAPKSGGNFGRSTSASTTRTTWDEIRNIQNRIIENGTNFDLEQVLGESYDISNSGGFGSGDDGNVLLLTLQLDMKNTKGGTKTTTSPERSPRPAEVKAWGATRALNLIVALERKIGSANIRPSSQIIKHNGSFWYSVTVKVNNNTNNTTTNMVGSHGTTNKKSEDVNILDEFIEKQGLVLEEESKLAMRGQISIVLRKMTPSEFESFCG